MTITSNTEKQQKNNAKAPPRGKIYLPIGKKMKERLDVGIVNKLPFIRVFRVFYFRFFF